MQTVCWFCVINQISHVWFGKIWGWTALLIFENLKLPSFFTSNYKIFKNELGQFIPNCPSKQVITSTNSMIKYDLLDITIFSVNKDLINYSKQASLHKVQRMIMIL